MFTKLVGNPARRLVSNQVSATFSTVSQLLRHSLDDVVESRSLKKSTVAPFMKASLAETDLELYEIIERDKKRQRESIILIASENYPSSSVLEASGSVLCNKYSEGYPGARYYGGNEFIDQSETLCQKRALEAFRLDPEEWGVNVQALSGSPANFYVYTALLNPHDRIMGLDLAHGGHLSHGHQISGKRISATSIYFESMHFRVDEKTGLINYDKMEELAHYYRPKLMIAGTSAYARLIDYARIRKVCDSIGAYLLGDICHISGLLAADVLPSPFPYCDVITTTTHKSLRGPRGALIFYRVGKKGVDKDGKVIMYNLKSKIDAAVFPGHQGGPHNHTIAAISTALHQCRFPEYKQYQQMVLKNSKAMASELLSRGYALVSGGTDNHLVLVDLNSKNLDGDRVDNVLDLINIAINKNTVPGDKSPLNPKGIRLGSPAMTSRGLEEKDFKEVIRLLDKGVIYANELKSKYPKKQYFKDWVKHEGRRDRVINELRSEVVDFATKFDVPF